MKIIETLIPSRRDTMIPLTVVEADSYPARLLICAHGFKANRKEDGRFVTVAKALAVNGITSVMMGFPGCDESKDDFINYTLKNCLDDIGTARAYMESNYEIIPDEMGMIGYSMGGRLTALYIAEHPEIKCIGLWAAASYDGFDSEEDFLGVSLKQIYMETEEKGYCDFHNEFDDTWIKLSKGLIDDMAQLKPEDGLKGYEGCALVVHGDEDITVPYAVAENTYAKLEKAKDKKLLTVHGADHGFGAWNDRPDLSAQLTDGTIEYFRKHLA